MTKEQIEKAKRMEDFTFTASNGATIHMDFSLLRSMTPEEREARARETQRVLHEMYIKYVVRPAMEAQQATV